VNDDRVIAVVRSSGVYRAADAVLRAVETAWRGSAARAVVHRAPAERVRFWSVAALTASATALALAPLGTDPRPLAWLVPAAAGLVSMLILVSLPR
jgi:hypothetical protein